MPFSTRARSTPWECHNPFVISMFLCMFSGYTTRPSMTDCNLFSEKSSIVVASGPITRSTLEWDISRSCQSATFSSDERQYPLRSRAMPVIFSERMGFFLCGIADEPFCPFPNGSMASSTSVRCRCLISVAIFSMVAPMMASVEKNCACRSL